MLCLKGLIVVDAFQAWCGPCKTVVDLFRKIRNEVGSDLLHFAVAEVDSIDALENYRGKCEPVFLFYAVSEQYFYSSCIAITTTCWGEQLSFLRDTLFFPCVTGRFCLLCICQYLLVTKCCLDKNMKPEFIFIYIFIYRSIPSALPARNSLWEGPCSL
uniref:Thioredoxin domain-containing protein n=1 Tax=Calidris pygmaea TaxID=425635 RepID=A0A8C3JZ61_9CHAR